MRAPRVAFIVDHPSRDLAGLVLTAAELCREGVICYLVPSDCRLQEIWALAPDAVILFHARRSMGSWAAELSKAGIQLGLLDTEGGVWNRPQDYSELLCDRSVLALFRYVCAWGPGLASHLEAGGFFAAGQLHVTGSPRFDFYSHQWRAALMPEEAAGSVASPPRILIGTRATEFNQKRTTIEKARRFLLESYRWAPERVDELLASQERSLAQMVDLARALSSSFPACRIVFRPHPFEDPSYYERYLTGVSGIEVNTSGPVQSQIFRAAALVQRGSTIGIEAGLAGVPSLSPEWLEVADPKPMIDSVGVPCAAYPDLVRQIDAILKGSFRMPKRIGRRMEETVSRWFCRVDGLAHRRVARTILEALPDRRVVSKDRCLRSLHTATQARRTGIEGLAARMRYRLGISPQFSFRRMRILSDGAGWMGSDRRFEASDVQEYLRAILASPGASNDRQRELRAAQTGERGEYILKYRGHSVSVSA